MRFPRFPLPMIKNTGYSKTQKCLNNRCRRRFLSLRRIVLRVTSAFIVASFAFHGYLFMTLDAVAGCRPLGAKSEIFENSN